MAAAKAFLNDRISREMTYLAEIHESPAQIVHLLVYTNICNGSWEVYYAENIAGTITVVNL
jgi:hypothetical protein